MYRLSKIHKNNIASIISAYDLARFWFKKLEVFTEKTPLSRIYQILKIQNQILKIKNIKLQPNDILINFEIFIQILDTINIIKSSGQVSPTLYYWSNIAWL